MQHRRLAVASFLLWAGCTADNPNWVPFDNTVGSDGGAPGDAAMMPGGCGPCTAPPARYCVDSSTLRTFSTGSCLAGVCIYPPADSTCAHGCAAGACVASGDPCMGVTCTTPPAPFCQDPFTLVGWSSTGTCVNGTCSYQQMQTVCTNGCASGACTGADPCAGVTCNMAPTCADSTTRRDYTGTCSNGTCSYSSTDTACTAPPNADPICSGGNCDFVCHTNYAKSSSGTSCVPTSCSGSMPDKCTTCDFMGNCNPFCTKLKNDKNNCGYCGTYCGGSCTNGNCSTAAWMECLLTPYKFASCDAYCQSVGKTCSGACDTFAHGAYMNYFDDTCQYTNTATGNTCGSISTSSSIKGVRCCCQ